LRPEILYLTCADEDHEAVAKAAAELGFQPFGDDGFYLDRAPEDIGFLEVTDRDLAVQNQLAERLPDRHFSLGLADFDQLQNQPILPKP
jgi:hypothetical protein